MARERFSAAPGTTSAISTSPASLASPSFRSLHRGQRSRALHGRRCGLSRQGRCRDRDDQLGLPRRHDRSPGEGGSGAPDGGDWASASGGSTIACATGGFHASATGDVRSRSSIARPAGGSGAKEDLPVTLPEDVTFDKPGNPLDHIPPGSTSLARTAGSRRGGRPTPSILSSIHPGTICVFARLTPRARSMPMRRATGCRSISISAGSSMRSFICSTRASMPGR